MLRRLLVAIALTWTLAAAPPPSFAQTAASSRYDLSTFEGRARLVVDSMAAYYADMPTDTFANLGHQTGKYGAYPTMALFEKGYTEKARRWAAIQQEGEGAMFRDYSAMALYQQYGDQYDEELLQKTKAYFVNRSFANPDAEGSLDDKMGGASNNHKLMYASAGHLACQEWPAQKDDAECRVYENYLRDWFDEITSTGHWEQDSPTYLVHHMGPVLSVAEHADDPEMARRAKMALEWYFAATAGEYLHGYWITAPARDKGPLYGLELSAETTPTMWMYFSDAPFVPSPESNQPMRHWWMATHFALSDYELPPIFREIATDRDAPYTHRELMAGNPISPREANYVASGYGLAAVQRADNQNVVGNETRWMLQWVAEDRREEPTAFLMKHPTPEEESWKEWGGASPHERTLQYQGDLVEVFDIPEGSKHPFIDGPYNADAYEATKQQDGWWFFHGGPVLFGVWADNGLRRTDETRVTRYGKRKKDSTAFRVDVLRSDGRKNALVVETASPDRFAAGSAEATLDAFAEAVLSGTEGGGAGRIDASGVDHEQPALSYVTLDGDTLAIEYDQYRRVNGEGLDFEDWPLLDDPWMHQDLRGRYLRLEHGGEERVYDFEEWTVETGPM